MLCRHVCCSVCVQCPWKSEDGVRALGAVVADGFEPQMEPGFSEEQSVLLSARGAASLTPYFQIFNNVIFTQSCAFVFILAYGISPGVCTSFASVRFLNK